MPPSLAHHPNWWLFKSLSTENLKQFFRSIGAHGNFPKNKKQARQGAYDY
ncbi:hypothetical protein HY17_06900 [Hyphomonas sp. CY54-11-8]|nr:hypothetical protein HY17_06900 [Hyphomonas sp. CY54-11-8]